MDDNIFKKELSKFALKYFSIPGVEISNPFVDPYRISLASSSGPSGYSFGIHQMDIGVGLNNNNPARILFNTIMQSAGYVTSGPNVNTLLRKLYTKQAITTA